MLERLKCMLIKEFLQVFRDPRMRAVIFLVPIIQVLVFGYAVNTDVRHIRTAVYDLDNSPSSRELAARFTGSGYFDAVRRVGSDAEVRELMQSGEVKAVFRFNRGFGDALQGGRTARAQLLLDGSDSNTASIVLGYASRIATDFNAKVMVDRFARSAGVRIETEPVAMASRAWFNPTLDSRYFFVPGIISQLVLIITVILSSMAVVREREIGTMEQIMVTPMGRLEFILGKTLPFAVIGFFDVLLITVVAVFWFEIPLAGSLSTLFLATGLYLLSTLGVGLLISTTCRTQQQAMMSTAFFLMPAILLSGFIYPIANMPESIQWLTHLNPLRHFLIIIRGVFLKGQGVQVLWPQMAALAVLGAALLFLAAGRFRKTSA